VDGREGGGGVSKDELNSRVARELFGWFTREKTDRLGDKILHWFNREGSYIGYQFPPTDPARYISDALPLLARHCWTLHTCDAGYRCQIHAAPERGEALLGDAVADSPMEAICLAVLEANKHAVAA
jgi:hypothetical protein